MKDETQKTNNDKPNKLNEYKNAPKIIIMVSALIFVAAGAFVAGRVYENRTGKEAVVRLSQPVVTSEDLEEEYRERFQEFVAKMNKQLGRLDAQVELAMLESKTAVEQAVAARKMTEEFTDMIDAVAVKHLEDHRDELVALVRENEKFRQSVSLPLEDKIKRVSDIARKNYYVFKKRNLQQDAESRKIENLENTIAENSDKTCAACRWISHLYELTTNDELVNNPEWFLDALSEDNKVALTELKTP